MSVPIVTATPRLNFKSKLLPRSHKAVSRACNAYVMRVHADKHLDEHFKRGAGRKYGYSQRRSSVTLSFLRQANPAAYATIKRLSFRGKTTNRGLYKDVKAALGLGPLEFTGRTREMVLNKFNQNITSTPKRGRLEVKTPAYVTSRIRIRGQAIRQKQMQALQRKAELEAITEGELRSLRKAWRGEYLNIQNNPSHPEHKHVAFRQRRKRRK